MRLHALVFACLVIGAHSATLPDKKDIEKKLTDAVKEVLDKEEAPINTSSEQELIDQANGVKEIENNLRKGVAVADIPVKVVVEEVQQLKTNPEVKENNEVADSEESAEIKRVEIDLKNPGPSQIMLHDNQNPEHHDNAQLVAAQALDKLWRSSPQYASIQTNIENIKESISQFDKSVQEYWTQLNEKSAINESEKKEGRIQLRSDTASSASSTTTAATPANNWPSFPQWNWPPNFVQTWQQQVSNPFSSNSTSSGNSCVNSVNTGSGTTNVNSQGGQSDEQKPPPQGPVQSILSTWNNNLQNFLQPSNAPASAQSDQQQQPGFFNQLWNNIRPGGQAQAASPVQPAPAPAPAPPQPAKPETTQEGANVVPAENQKEDKPQTAQPVTQSGPIKQFIGRNPIVQGLAGAVQRIQHTIVPPKPRDEVKEAEIKDGQTKFGFKPPHPPVPGNNIDISSSGVAVKSEPEEKPEVPVVEPVKEEAAAPVAPEKTE